MTRSILHSNELLSTELYSISIKALRSISSVFQDLIHSDERLKKYMHKHDEYHFQYKEN